MPKENYQIVAGIIISMIVLLIATTFIFMLVMLANNRKRKFIQEKMSLQQLFNEQLLQSQLEMQEQTFNTISKEIHDNVGQVLSLAKVQINIMEQGEVLNRLMLNDVKESISKAMVDLRDIAKSLNSERITQNSLVEITNQELQRVNRLGILRSFLYVEGKEENLKEQKKLIVFRILQESLQNILKHAKATKIEVFFTFSSNDLKLEIVDDGVGFDKEKVSEKQGLGLRNIISRAALIGGQGSINSIINQGTTVTIFLPYV